MSVESVPARGLRAGMRLALPFGRTATIQGDPKVGRQFVNFRTEHGPSRVEVEAEVLIESEEP